MSTHDNGGPAYPVNELNGDGSLYAQHLGVTVRDVFAMKAMQGELACMQDHSGEVCGIPLDAPDSTFDRLAAHWYRIADAMLKARAEQ